MLAGACWVKATTERALPYLEESLALAKTQKLYTAYILQTLANLHFAQEDYITARRLSEEAFCQTKEQGNDDVFIQQRTMLGRGNVALAQGDPSAALADHRTALRVAVDPEGTLDCLEGIAASLAGLGEYEQAVILTASADRGRKELFIPLPPNRHSRHAQQTEMFARRFRVPCSSELGPKANRYPLRWRLIVRSKSQTACSRCADHETIDSGRPEPHRLSLSANSFLTTHLLTFES